MRGLADKAFAAGFNVVLLNQRNCGGTEQLSAGLYHSGLTADADYVIREIAAVDGIAAGRRRGLLARRQSGAEARRRLRRRAAAAAARRLRRLARDGARGVRARARAAPELRLPVEFRARPEGPDAPQGASAIPGRFAVDRLDAIRTRPRVRRGLHGAALRLRERVRLLPPRQRDARRSTASRVPALHHHRRGRPVRADGAVPRPERDGQSVHPRDHHAHGGHCAFVDRPARRRRRLLGRARDRGVRDDGAAARPT